MPAKKVECQYCHKKFHPKGVYSHRARCRRNTPHSEAPKVAAQNLVALSPFQTMSDAVDSCWRALSLGAKFRALSDYFGE